MRGPKKEISSLPLPSIFRGERLNFGGVLKLWECMIMVVYYHYLWWLSFFWCLLWVPISATKTTSQRLCCPDQNARFIKSSAINVFIDQWSSTFYILLSMAPSLQSIPSVWRPVVQLHGGNWNSHGHNHWNFTRLWCDPNKHTTFVWESMF